MVSGILLRLKSLPTGCSNWNLVTPLYQEGSLSSLCIDIALLYGRRDWTTYHIRQVLIKVRGVYRGVSVYKGVYVRVTIYIYGYYSPYYSILPYKEGVMCIDGGVYRWRCDVYRWRCVYEYLS